MSIAVTQDHQRTSIVALRFELPVAHQSRQFWMLGVDVIDAEFDERQTAVLGFEPG